jgi:hypothetical protein
MGAVQVQSVVTIKEARARTIKEAIDAIGAYLR